MAKQQSLAEIASGKSLDVVVDDFGGLSVAASSAIGPYVLFAQPKATDQWTSLVQKLPGIQDGDQVLVYPDPEPPIRLTPMRFTMMACKQFWVKLDDAGNQVGAPSVEQKPRAERWNEWVFAACIVYAQRDGEVEAVPSTCMFKTVKCPAAVTLKLQIEAADKPEWADQSMAHKAAFSAFSKAFLRVVASVQTSKRTAGSGFSYVQARSIVAPATPTEYIAVKKLLEAKGLEKFKSLLEQYNSRLAQIGVPSK